MPQAIDDVKLDKESLEAVEDIRRILKNTKLLAAMLSASIVLDVFAGRGSKVVGGGNAGFKVGSNDWTLFGQAMAAVPTIGRASARKVAELQWFRCMQANDRKQQLFWKGVAESFH